MLFCVSVLDYFLLLSGVLLYEYMPVYLSIHPLINIFFFFASFWMLKIKLL